MSDAEKALQIFDLECLAFNPEVSPHERRVKAMAKALAACPEESPTVGEPDDGQPTPAPLLVQREATMASELDPKGLVRAHIAFHEGEKLSDQIPAAIRAYLTAAPSPSPAPGVVEALPENVLEDAAKAAFIKAQSVYRGLHDHLPLKNTWETLTESIRDGWRAIAHAALEAAYMPPLGTQPEPRLPRDVPSTLASISQPAKGEREGEQPMLSPEEEAAIVEDINSGRWPYLQPLSGDGPPVISTPADPEQGVDARYDSVALEAARDIMKLTRAGEHDDHLKAKIQVRIIEAITAAIGAVAPTGGEWRAMPAPSLERVIVAEEIRREARSLLNEIIKPDYVRSDAVDFIARALLARDRRAAEIARLEALRTPERRTKNLGLVRKAYPHEIGNHIATAILTYEGSPAKEERS